MKYILLIQSTATNDRFSQLSEAEQGAVMGEYFALRQDPAVTGGEQLQPPETATTVRVENGERLITDGPFADTKEVLAGYYLVEAASLDVALDVAARIPAARFGGSIEVRPLVEH